MTAIHPQENAQEKARLLAEFLEAPRSVRESEESPESEASLESIVLGPEGLGDVTIFASLDGEFKGAEVTLEFGGPSAWLDTREHVVRVIHGTASASWGVSPGVCEVIDDIVREVWESRA